VPLALASVALLGGLAAPAPAQHAGHSQHGQHAPKAPTKVAASKFKTLPGGLKYAVLKPGKGNPVPAHSQVDVHYTGWLQSSGKKFDSSLDRGRPFTFTLGHGDVIQGWDQGVKGMKVGERRQLVIPPALGYGASGTPGGPIPPNATLIFEVELLKIGAAHRH
jgi:peptidylprolyl isomerase